MDGSPGSDVMDWKEDSSLHIIQPASSPWRKRSFDTYNETNEPYRPNEDHSGYRVTDTLRHHPEPVEPSIDFNGRFARFATDFDGNVILQPIIQQQPPKPIGAYLPELVKWIIYGGALLVCGGCVLAGEAYIHTATVAVRVGNSAKRRLVQVTQKTFAPAPPPRRRRRDVPPHRRQSPIIRRVSPTSSGSRTHIPVTPPRARPMATLKEAAASYNECIIDYAPSNIKHVRSGAFVTSHEDDHQMSGIIHHPCFEPLMSGALQDMEIDEDAQSNAIPSFSPYHIPGKFPDSPPPPALPPTESPAPQLRASVGLAIPHDQNIDDMAMSQEQGADEVATPRSEASDESDIQDVQPTIKSPLQNVDSRLRNYKGELLDDWQIKVCREFQAIHPPPREIRQQAASAPVQPHGLNSTGLIQSHRSPLANGSPTSPHQQNGMTATGLNDSRRSPLANGSPTSPHQQNGMTATGLNDSRRSPLANGSPTSPHQQNGIIATGLIDSRRSPMANASHTGAADGTMGLYGSTGELLDQPHGMTSNGLNDLHRSPLDLHIATTEVVPHPHVLTSTGSNDLHRSPLDLDRATTEVFYQPHGTTSIGSNDLHRSPLADASPTRAGDVLNDSHDASTDISHQPPRTATIGSIDSPRSPLADKSLINSPHGTSPTGSIDLPRSPLAESPMEAAVDVMNDTQEAGPDVSDHTTPVPARSPVRSPPATTATKAAESPSKRFMQSIYARIQGKPKKRSPLCERVNNANIHKVPITPKNVSWPVRGAVTRTKRFVKGELISHPSPASSSEDSSILSSVPSDFSPQPSPTMQEEEEETALHPAHQTYPPTPAGNNSSMSPISSTESHVSNSTSTNEHTDATHNRGEEQTISSSSSSDNEASVQSVQTPTQTAAADPSTPPSHLSPKFEELKISTRRSSLRRREKEDQEQKLKDAIAAEEKARKEKEEAEEKARKEKEEAEEKALKEKEEAEEKARKEKEEAEEKARIEVEEEEERKKTGGRRIPVERVIQSLPPGWDEKVRINMAKGMREQLAMTSVGNPLTRRDFGMILPQSGTGDDPSGWLNDEIISGYLQAVVDHGHRAMGHPRGAKPQLHAFNPFFYTTLKERGYDAVKRWSTRAKVGGNDLKTVEYVFIPCNPSKNHWTLVVVCPVRKTIEVFDSMHGPALDKVNTTKSWLRGEFGGSYVDSEWTVVEDPEYRGRGKGPTQNNVNDCGVFAVTTAKMVVLGVDPMAVSANDMPLQRRRLVAELLNGGFSGEFEPRVVFE